VYFNVNLKLVTKLINSAFVGECVNYVDFKMHGATIKKLLYRIYMFSLFPSELPFYFQLLFSLSRLYYYFLNTY